MKHIFKYEFDTREGEFEGELARQSDGKFDRNLETTQIQQRDP